MSEIKQATAAEILAIWGKRPKQPFDIPGAGRVWVHGLTDLEVAELYQSADRDPEKPDELNDPYFRAKLVQRSVRGEDGQAIFTEGDVMRIAGANRLMFVGLIALCEKLSAIGGQADQDLLKNFEATAIAGS